MVGVVEADTNSVGSKPPGKDTISPPPSNSNTNPGTGQSKKETSNSSKGDVKNGSNGRHGLSTPPPQAQQVPSYQHHYLYPQLDPNQLSGYYPYQAAMSPDPNSPSTPSNRYVDLQAAFLQQQAAGGAFGATTPYATGLPQLPLSPHPSPSTNGNASMGGAGAAVVLPPASPLFPGGYPPHEMEASRMYNPSGTAAPPSPGMSYMASPLTGPAIYQGTGYGGAVAGYVGNQGNDPKGGSPSGSPPHGGSWSDRNVHQQLYQQSPQLQPQGIHAAYSQAQARNNSYRAPSFDEMLPPSAASSGNEQNQENYNQFATQAAAIAASINGSSNNPTLFAQQWGGYPPSPHHMDYSAQQQHHQAALTMSPMLGQSYSGGSHQRHSRGGQHGGGAHKYQPGGPYYHTATTPGPPIQTTACNKGPDGANLFIFHIPNHFTNLDMYHLFCKYGTLLSVRIMVEKDTGRSRGFGFVSYDSPESAALAIKELNGFVIGNKRLKVQHKQIRATDHSTSSHHQPSYPPDSREGTNWYDPSQTSDNQDDVGNKDTPNQEDDTLDENTSRQVNALPTEGLSQLTALRDALPDISK